MSDPMHSDRPDTVPIHWPRPRLQPVPALQDDVVTDPGPVTLSDVVADLRHLRRGRGVLASHVDRQIGPAVRTLAGVGDADGPAETRVKVARWLCQLAADLPADLRMAALTAFAVAPDARQRVYKDRVELVANRIQRDGRTVRRRIDEAIEQIAQRATARPGFAGLISAAPIGGARVTELCLSLALDRPQPALLEHCRFTAEQDDIDEITLFTSRLAGFAGLAGRLTTTVDYGGTFDARGTGVLRPPRPLRVGESHEYVVSSVVPCSDLLPRQLCLTTDRHCDRADLRVRFDPRKLPTHVEPIGDDAPAVRPDEAGEVLVSVTDLPPGHAHGLRWE